LLIRYPPTMYDLLTRTISQGLQAFLPIVDRMVEEGLVVLTDVDVIKYTHRASDR